jgi:hypothetical protein
MIQFIITLSEIMHPDIPTKLGSELHHLKLQLHGALQVQFLHYNISIIDNLQI